MTDCEKCKNLCFPVNISGNISRFWQKIRLFSAFLLYNLIFLLKCFSFLKLKFLEIFQLFFLSMKRAERKKKCALPSPPHTPQASIFLVDPILRSHPTRYKMSRVKEKKNSWKDIIIQMKCCFYYGLRRFFFSFMRALSTFSLLLRPAFQYVTCV